MTFDFVSNIEQCAMLVKESVSLGLVYYSHIPTAIISLFIGLLVYFKGGKSLISKIFFSLCLVFSLFLAMNIILWTSYDSRMYMFFWSIGSLTDALIFMLGFYFFYVFIYERDIPFLFKIIGFLFLVPIIFYLGTPYNLVYFDGNECVPVEEVLFKDYVDYLKIIIFSIILIFSFREYKKAKEEEKRKVRTVAIGLNLFLAMFLFANMLSNYVIEKGYLEATVGYSYELYGLFGMPVFIGFLAYAIVKFNIMNIKLLGIQILVWTIIFLIGSQFFFIQNRINMVLTAISLILISIAGFMLIGSTKRNIQRKEELQKMADKLLLANDRLKQLDRVKSEFISIASHQLRTPLTAIKGFVSLILEGSYGSVEASVRNALNKVYLSNDRLIQLVEDLLNISRIESGKFEYTFAPCQLDDVVESVFEMLRIRARDAGLEFTLKLPEEKLPQILVDEAKIREVLWNLIDNAIKYTKKGFVRISIFEDSGKIVIAIQDSGIGILPEDSPNLFEKFCRGKDTGRLHASGTGLGLYVGKKIILAHKGKITFVSEGEGKGTIFTITLPLDFKPEEKNKEQDFLE
ncbi:MAG: HAMP domain-containing histidine kinase [Candidatus Moraniibacteriota bacterium]|nr:MAG: HAMP domain-containing histidine kinase [Candidatus Moranbacteria bacterium]